MVWMFVPLQNSYVEILNLKGDVVNGTHEVGSPHEWD